MSTRSYIAIEKFNSNNVPYYDAIYCHQDSYPDYLGEILMDFYDEEHLVNKLLNKGHVISLAETLEDSEFFTDRGEKFDVVRNVSFKELTKIARSQCEYIYIFFPEHETWLYCERDDRFRQMHQI